MGSIMTEAATVYRDFATDGVQSSGVHEPQKSAIRALFGTVEQAVATSALGTLLSAKFATMTAANAGSGSLDYADGKLALIIADNELAVKTGASGTGGWTLTTILRDLVAGVGQPVVDDAQDAADAAAASAASAAASAGGNSPFLTPPGSGSALASCIDVQWRTHADDGTLITIPAIAGVFNFSRDGGGAGARTLIRVGSYATTGSSAVTFAAENPAGDIYIEAPGTTDDITIDLFATSTATGAKVGERLGTISFPAANFGSYGALIPLSEGRLRRRTMLPNKTLLDNIDARIAIALALEAGRNDGVFIAPVRDAKLRDRYQAAKIIGGSHDRNRYIISSDAWTVDTLNGVWFARATVRDVVDGYDVCQLFQNWNSDPTGLGVQPVLFSQGLLGANSGIIMAAMVDLGQAWTDNYIPRTYTTTAQAGIAPANVLTTEELDSFLDRPIPVRSIRTGAGEGVATATAGTTSLYDLFPNPTYSTFPISSECTPATPVEVLMAVNGTVENCSGLVTPPGLILRGRGWAASALRNDTAGKRVLETTQSFAAIDLSLLQFADDYIDHSDNFGGLSGIPSVGAAEQRWFIRQLWRRVLFYSGPAMQQWGVGMGLSPGMRAFWEDSLFVQESTTSTAAPIGIHNTPGGNQNGALAHIKRVTFRQANAACPSIQLLSSFGSSTRARVIVEGCTAQLIAGSCALLADNDANMPRRARDRWAFDLQIIGGTNTGVDIVDPKMRVLTANAGTTISGTAGPGTAWDIFGPRHDVKSGKGEFLTLDGSIRALEATLGDRRSAPKTLTFTRSGYGSETVNLAADYRGMSEGAIIAAINGQLNNYVVGTARIDGNLAVLS